MSARHMNTTVCVIDDGRPGHVNQTLGILRMLDLPEEAIHTVRVTVRRKFLKRPILLALGLFGRLPRRLLALAYAGYYGQRPPALDSDALILSTGGDTLVANIILARIHGRKNVFTGKRHHVTKGNVALLVTGEGSPIPGKVIVLPFAPVYPKAGPRLNVARDPGIRLCAVLVGGDSQEYHYAEADYLTLARALNQICERDRMRLLITTSRRTGSTGENALRATLNPRHIAEAIWYGEAPRPTASAYCEAGDFIVVTEDSGTMLTEALAFAKPLIAVSPEKTAITPFYADFLDRVGGQGLHRCPISGIAEMDISNLPPARPVDNSELVTGIRRLLGRDDTGQPSPDAHRA